MITPRPIPALSKQDRVRFWEKVDKNGPIPTHRPELGECWAWMKFVEKAGYGIFGIRRASVKAHRVSWSIVYGEIPKGQYVLHKCDRRHCVNPSHLFLGTYADNAKDMMAKGRKNPSPGEKNGEHKLTDAEVLSMRDQYLTTSATGKTIAQGFGVDHSTAKYILRGQSWKHILREGELEKLKATAKAKQPTNRRNGEGVNTAKLTPEAVLQIRELCRLGKDNHTVIALRFGVSPTNVGSIAKRKIWVHI